MPPLLAVQPSRLAPSIKFAVAGTPHTMSITPCELNKRVGTLYSFSLIILGFGAEGWPL